MNVLTDDFYAVPDGEIYPVMYRKGDVVTGSVLEAAERLGKIEAQPVPTDEHVKDDARPRGRPPKAKAFHGAPERK